MSNITIRRREYATHYSNNHNIFQLVVYKKTYGKAHMVTHLGDCEFVACDISRADAARTLVRLREIRKAK